MDKQPTWLLIMQDEQDFIAEKQPCYTGVPLFTGNRVACENTHNGEFTFMHMHLAKSTLQKIKQPLNGSLYFRL